MDEHAIRELAGEVTRGRLSRRRFVQAMVGAGLTAPMAARILGAAGLAEAQPSAVFAVGNAIRGFDFSPFSGPLWRLVSWSREA
jgi:hypothetical protein